MAPQTETATAAQSQCGGVAGGGHRRGGLQGKHLAFGQGLHPGRTQPLRDVIRQFTRAGREALGDVAGVLLLQCVVASVLLLQRFAPVVVWLVHACIPFAASARLSA